MHNASSPLPSLCTNCAAVGGDKGGDGSGAGIPGIIGGGTCESLDGWAGMGET